MMAPGEKLSRKQEVAIAALLTCPTLAEAAQRAGISEPTLGRWLRRDDFQTAYRQARREAVSQAIAHLQRVSGEAVETLRAIMADGKAPASARVTAARAVLEVAIKAVELEDLEARIADLEARLTAEHPEGNAHVRA
jgi:DNA-binding MurR/RpiR family transcriptional regulator